MTEALSSTNSSSNAPYKYRWLVLTVMLAAEIMDLLDSTIVNVAGPDLAKALGANSIDLQWIIGGYTLTLGAGLILGGRLIIKKKSRNMFLFGVIGFTLASVACSLAIDPTSLIASRLIQGFLGAMLLPQGFGLIRASFPPEEYGKAFAVFGPVFGLGGILGPVLGGAIIEANLFDLGWRSVFLVNLPIGLIATIIAWRVLPKTAGDRAIKIDLFGAAIVVVASALLVYPLIQGQVEGWPAWTWISIAASLVGFYLFTLQQGFSAKRGGTPLIDNNIFKNRAYPLGLGGIFLFFASMTGLYLVISLFLQIGQGFSAGEAGLGNIPIAVGSAIGGTLSGAVLIEKIGRRVLQLGAALQVVGAAALWIGVTSFDSFSIWNITPGLVVAGVGTGLVIAALFDLVLSSVGDKEVGSASGVLSAVQSIGSSVGVAIFGTVFFENIKQGDFNLGFTSTLIASFVFLGLFLALVPAFPKRVLEHREG
jgi:EmrB/QacA subfamily drug resistance transporter